MHRVALAYLSEKPFQYVVQLLTILLKVVYAFQFELLVLEHI